MQDLNEIHKTLETKRREMRELNRMFKDELRNNSEYQTVVDELQTLREKKKSIESAVAAASQAALANLDLLKLDVKSYTEMLSDVALNKYAANENIEIVDENNVRWLPSFTVKFKKEDGEPEKAVAKEKNAPQEMPIIAFGEGAMA
jgi:translation elongation factor EF-1alpha